MLERHGQLRLAGEALAEALVERKLGRDELQRDRPLQAQVVRAVDDAHPAAADQLVDPVADEVGADADRLSERSSVPQRRLGDASLAFGAEAC